MVNSVMLVGRLVKLNNDIMTLLVNRNFKNENGEYDSDEIKCVISGGLLDNVKEYVKNNDIVGVRGRLEIKEDELIVIAEKISFLSSNKTNE